MFIKLKQVLVAAFFLDYDIYLFGEGERDIGWGIFPVKDMIVEGANKKIISGESSIPKLRENFELPNEIVSNFKEAFGCYVDGYTRSDTFEDSLKLYSTIMD